MDIDPPPEWADMPGRFEINVGESHSDYFTRNQVVVRAVHRMPPTENLPVYKRAAWVPVSREVLQDVPSLGYFVQRALDRAMRPWAYPDHPVLIPFTPFPRWDRLVRWVRHLTRRH